MEHNGVVTVIEAKNSFLKDFAVYQIFHHIKYYSQKLKDSRIPLEKVEINACYVLRQKRGNSVCLRLYLYEFNDLDRIDSIQLVRKAEYQLVRR